MIPYFPKQISYRAFATYLISLLLVNIAYYSYAMLTGYIILGVFFVGCFFLLTSTWSQTWKTKSEKQVVTDIFIIALVIRLVWVVSSYFYYLSQTGIPFEFAAADSLGYHNEAKWLASENWSMTWDYYFGPRAYGISDTGYPLYLSIYPT